MSRPEDARACAVGAGKQGWTMRKPGATPGFSFALKRDAGR